MSVFFLKKQKEKNVSNIPEANLTPAFPIYILKIHHVFPKKT